MLNQAAEELIGMPRADVIGKTAEAIYPAEYVELVRKEDEELLRSGELFIDDHTIELRGKEPRIVTLTRKLLKDDKGAPQFMLAVIHDITERKRAEERIEHLAHHDPLTDLPNRAAVQRAPGVGDRAGRSIRAVRFAVLCIDLDRLKEVNDVFGHAAGDQLLCEVSRRLLAAAAGRFPRAARRRRVRADRGGCGRRPRASPRSPIDCSRRSQSDLDIQGAQIRAGLSIGVAVYPDDGRDATTLLANADAALYRAKAEGRGVTRFFKAGHGQAAA